MKEAIISAQEVRPKNMAMKWFILSLHYLIIILPQIDLKSMCRLQTQSIPIIMIGANIYEPID